MESCRNYNRHAASLALAPPEGDAAALGPDPVIYPEAAAASNEANLGTSSKMDLSAFVPALSQCLDGEIV